MVDKLEAMLARWPVLSALVVGACSVGMMITTVTFLRVELSEARLETAVARSEALNAKIEAHDATVTQTGLKRELDAMNAKINRIENNIMFGREGKGQ